MDITLIVVLTLIAVGGMASPRQSHVKLMVVSRGACHLRVRHLSHPQTISVRHCPASIYCEGCWIFHYVRAGGEDVAEADRCCTCVAHALVADVAGLARVSDACPLLPVRLELAELVEPWSVRVRELVQTV